MTERFANTAERLAKMLFRSNTWKEVSATVQSSAYHPSNLYNLTSGEEGDKRFVEITFSAIPSMESNSSTNTNVATRWMLVTKLSFCTTLHSQARITSLAPIVGLAYAS
jgi:hypothetical protein